jgi:hypothetical protein
MLCPSARCPRVTTMSSRTSVSPAGLLEGGSTRTVHSAVPPSSRISSGGAKAYPSGPVTNRSGSMPDGRKAGSLAEIVSCVALLPSRAVSTLKSVPGASGRRANAASTTCVAASWPTVSPWHVNDQLCLERDADLLADANEGGGVELSVARSCPAEGQGKPHRCGVSRPDRVSVIDALGRWVVHGLKRNAAALRKVDHRGNAGSARIAPVCLPAGFQIHVQKAANGAIVSRCRIDHQAHPPALCLGPGTVK